MLLKDNMNRLSFLFVCPLLTVWKLKILPDFATDFHLMFSHTQCEKIVSRGVHLRQGFFIRGSVYMYLGVLTKSKGTLTNNALNYVLQHSRSDNYFKTYYFPFISNLTMPYYHYIS